MGHVYYHLAFANQPFFNYFESNQAFAEAVGDTTMLAATNLGNLINMGLLDRNEDRQNLKMNQLMYSALRKFPFVYFAYITDVWYFDFFTRKIDDAKLNEHWWYLVKKYQGLTTPEGEERGEEYLDIAALRHVAMGLDMYSIYQLAVPLQFQFFKAMCKSAGEGYFHFSDCNIAGKPEATKKFREMLSKGKSVNWKILLKELTGEESVSTKETLEYFKPLEDWLDDYIEDNNVTVVRTAEVRQTMGLMNTHTPPGSHQNPIFAEENRQRLTNTTSHQSHLRQPTQ
ncbi:angiotensin-converting enzyme-like [Convolutriloba macropyga]|uniref:angiotensin-converting enzyme-like n=1 Tax=Convolutriloba macropyga TaxID=536237 RepID=UPI003F51E71F